MKNGNSKSDHDDLPRLIGERIREKRKAIGLSLAQLSEVSGVSVSMISKIEKCKTLPPISTYSNLASALGVSFSDLVVERESKQIISVVKAGQTEPISNGVYNAHILAKHFTDKRFTPFLIHFPEKKGFHKPFVHSHSQEMMYILQGKIEFSYDDKKYELEKGDCVCYKGDKPHTSRTMGDEEVWILAVQIPD